MKKVYATAALALAFGAPSGATEIAGYVLEQRGRWTIDGNGAPLAVGDPVTTGARLAASAPSAGDQVTIVAVRTGRILVSRRCDATLACATPLVVDQAGPGRPSPTPLAEFLDRAVARLATQPDRYVSTLSRGSARLADAVLRWSPQGADLGALFFDLPDGRYQARLVALRCRGSAACPAQPVLTEVDWQRGRPAAPVPGVEPGLYELTLTRPAGGAGPERARGWILLVGEAEHAVVSERYLAALGLVDAWGADVEPATKHAFTRALLDALAAP